MILLATTGITRALSSAVVGGVAVGVSLCLLALAQILSWRSPPGHSSLTRAAMGASALSCVIVIVLIAARFLIID